MRLTTAIALALALPSARGAISVSYDAALGASYSGRVRVYVSASNSTPPSEQSSDGLDTAQVYAVDVDAWAPGAPVVVDGASGGDAASPFGFPLRALSDLPPSPPGGGPWFVQAELAVYVEYARAGLPAVALPTSCVSFGGANGEYAKPDGTLLSAVYAYGGGGGGGDVELRLDRAVPPSRAASPGCAGLGDGVDSPWMKTVRLNSSLLGAFWGRAVKLEACVLVPYGFDDDPKEAAKNASYPLVVAHGHYSPRWFAGGSWRETPPACDPAVDGYACVQEQYAWWLYTNWTAPSGGAFEGARMLIATINHPVPLFDDSYAVNSATLGPYGDAIWTELVPAIEKRFRGLGAGWARGVFGGSTGGWESLASLVFYPDELNFAVAACPDPITFTSYTTVNIYDDANAYYYDSTFRRTKRPGYRDHYSGTTWPGFVRPYGQVGATVEEMNHRELALGAHSRSCGQARERRLRARARARCFPPHDSPPMR